MLITLFKTREYVIINIQAVLLTITSNLMKIFQEMAEEWQFELNMTWPVALQRFPA